MSWGPIKGRKFVLVGEFSLYQCEVKDLIAQYGGEVFDYVPQRDMASVTVVIGGKSDPKALRSNKKLQFLQSSRCLTITEDDLEGWIRNDPTTVEEFEARHAAETQAKLEAHQHYGEW